LEKLAFLCEGSNDTLVIKSVVEQLVPNYLLTTIKQQGGINRLFNGLSHLAPKLIAKGYIVIAIYDEADLAKTKTHFAIEHAKCVLAPAKCKIEAWLLADRDAIYGASGFPFPGPFPTDLIEDPKDVFLHHFHRAVRERKRSYIFKERDFFKATLLCWKLKRARENNISLNKLCERIEHFIA